jgi:hypothetical protein
MKAVRRLSKFHFEQDQRKELQSSINIAVKWSQADQGIKVTMMEEDS